MAIGYPNLKKEKLEMPDKKENKQTNKQNHVGQFCLLKAELLKTEFTCTGKLLLHLSNKDSSKMCPPIYL